VGARAPARDGAVTGLSVDPLDIESLRRHPTPGSGTASEADVAPSDDEIAPDAAAP
jgi:hypothetical protein